MFSPVPERQKSCRVAARCRATPNMAKFVPTTEHRHQVTVLMLYGMPHAAIAETILNPSTGKPLSESAFRKYFAQECKTLAAQMNAKVMASLYQLATDRKVKDAARARAATFWIARADALRARAEANGMHDDAIEGTAEEVPRLERRVEIPADLSGLSDDELHELARRAVALD